MRPVGVETPRKSDQGSSDETGGKPASSASSGAGSVVSALDRTQLILSAILFVLLLLVAGFGIRHRNNPTVSLHCILLAAVVSIAFYLLGELIYSYLASNDPRVHFGLGAADEVTDIVVRWLGGDEERFEPLATGEYHSLRQNRGKK